MPSSNSYRHASAPHKKHSIDGNSAATPLIDDYDKLQGPSLLKRTLGLQHNRHSVYLGPTSEYEPSVPKSGANYYSEVATLRHPSRVATFITLPDEHTYNQEEDISDLDTIESLVAPHGKALIHLYFRIVHPSFPVLHKKVYLEKYSRTHREFSPPLLAAVYILALSFWGYSSDLSHLPKPDVSRLEKTALKSLSNVVHRPKLSTIQAGLLLLQRPNGSSWVLTAQMVAVAQELGLHVDCTFWDIPSWEIGLRKRLGWALYIQSAWASLVHGRPPHISTASWKVQPLSESDFPETADDEDDEQGSTEVEKGRLLFSKLATLTQILSDILDILYFHSPAILADDADGRESGISEIEHVLEMAKPLQIRLRSWYSSLPETLSIEKVRPRKLSSTGYLHLAYYAVEVTLHRRIIRSISAATDNRLTSICRTAAKARLTNAMQLVNRLRPEHLQGFWHFSSQYNFTILGIFQVLLGSTAPNEEDAEFYWGTLRDYCWTLRVSSKSAEFLATTANVLDRIQRNLDRTDMGSTCGKPNEIWEQIAADSEMEPFFIDPGNGQSSDFYEYPSHQHIDWSEDNIYS